MTATPVSARQRNGFGLTALVLGLVGIALAVFPASTWFVVVPLGLLTLVFGSAGLGHARGHLIAAGKSAAAGTLAGAVTLAMGVWGTSTFLASLNHLRAQFDDATVRPGRAPDTAPPAGDAVGWGQPYPFGTGLVLIVAAPSAAPPPVPHGAGRVMTSAIDDAVGTRTADSLGRRTVVITVTVVNRGSTTYPFDATAFGPTATFDGRALSAVTDSAHLFEDSPSAGASSPVGVPPGGTSTFQLVYALPVDPGDLRLEFRPDPAAGPGVVSGPA